MDEQQKITISQWHELSEDQKEAVRVWAVKHDFGLDIIPSTTSETCDYAALLTLGQLQQFFKEQHVPFDETDGLLTLWQKMKALVAKQR